MLYDDVAQDPENPFPGTLFNWPTQAGSFPVDVYEHCAKDYTGNDVTAANLLAVLQGAPTSTGGPTLSRVTDNDKVLINFVDHGAAGLVAMPVGDYLYADQLLSALANATFGEMVFYLEACESGSMFESLPSDTSIYGLTAANAEESSWGCYCPPGDTINGTSLGTCLGDQFSVAWMEDIDDPSEPARIKETLQAQYQTLVLEVNMSHPSQFGDPSFRRSEAVGAFFSNWWAGSAGDNSNVSRFAAGGDGASSKGGAFYPSPAASPVASARRASLLSLETRAARGSARAAALLQAELAAVARTERALARLVGGNDALAREAAAPLVAGFAQYDCYRAAVAAFEAACGRFTDATLGYAKLLARQCALAGGDAAAVTGRVAAACGA